MNTCPNEKCQGRLLYQGTSSVNGAFIDWYKCLKRLTVHTAEADHAAPLIASDMDDADDIHEWMFGGDIPVGLDHAAPLLTGDEDTEPLAIVRDEVQS